MVFACIVSGVLCAIISSVITFKVVLSQKSHGELLFNDSDPDGPYLFLQLKTTPYEIMTKRSVMLEVKPIHTNSQK